MTPDLVSVILRALGFVALFQAAGAAFFLTLFGSRLDRSRAGIRRLIRLAAGVGAACVLAHLLLEPARLAGEFDGLWDPDLQRLAWDSGSGAAQLLQLLGLLGILVLPLRSASPGRWTSSAAVLALGGFLLTGHTSAHPLRGLLAPLLGLHLLIIAFWFGALAPLLLVCRAEPLEGAAHTLRRFSLLAGWLVPLILVAGGAMAWILAGSWSVLDQPYGQLLLVKLAGFLVLMLLAAGNRWRFAPGLAGHGMAAPLRRAIVAEYTLIVAILATTAVLTTYFSPR